MAGDLLDLHVALAPCVIGYAEIAVALKTDLADRIGDCPYASWIETYAGEEYQQLAGGQAGQLDHLLAERGGPGRLTALTEIFRQATRLETKFWDMGLALAD
jgi:thiaminase/transcriptional activator TenA